MPQSEPSALVAFPLRRLLDFVDCVCWFKSPMLSGLLTIDKRKIKSSAVGRLGDPGEGGCSDDGTLAMTIRIENRKRAGNI